MLNPDIVAKVKFYSAENGGKENSISMKVFPCIFVFEDKNYECRLLLDQVGTVSPGDIKEIPIVFLCPENVIPLLKKGCAFYLRDGAIIASGEVAELFS